MDQRTAALLTVLIQTHRPGRVLHVTGDGGACTLTLARALAGDAGGGRVTSVDRDARTGIVTSRTLRAAGLTRHAEVRIQAPAVALAGSADGAWDMVVLPAHGGLGAACWSDLTRALAPGGVLMAVRLAGPA